MQDGMEDIMGWYYGILLWDGIMAFYYNGGMGWMIVLAWG